MCNGVCKCLSDAERVHSTSSLGEGSVTSLAATPQKKAPKKKRKPTINATTKTKLSVSLQSMWHARGKNGQDVTLVLPFSQGSTQELAAELSASGLGRRDAVEELIQKV